MTEAKETKDTIYIDIDDEITSIIDKMRSSDQKIVALVLPKRATVLQSIVNMKLLKHTAAQSDKNVVLITSEAGLLPLAGAVGLHVAPTLQSKPAIPPPPDSPSALETPIEEDAPEAPEPKVDKATSVGELAGATAVKAQAKEETIDLDNSDEPEDKADAGKPKDKKTKVPNFDRFRKKLLFGGLALVAIIVLWVFAFKSLPKAAITIKTDTSTQEVSPDITVDTDAKSLSPKNAVVPGNLKEIKHSDSQTAAATGEKNIGNKASGTINISQCKDSGDEEYSGVKFTANGKTFSANKTFIVGGATFVGGICTGAGTGSVNVTAIEGGDSYNQDATTYKSTAMPNYYTINGSKMTGGTTNIVKIISQSDVDSAKQKLVSEKDETQQDLQKALQEDGLFAITDTFNGGKTAITASPKVGERGDSVTVSSTTTYTMLGVKEDDLKKVIDESIKAEIDTNKQAVQDYGLSSAAFTVNDKNGNQTHISLQTTLAIGPKLDLDDVKQRVAGKKEGDIQNDIGNEPGVKEVIVDYSPFWVSKAPKNTAKITVVIESANEQQP